MRCSHAVHYHHWQLHHWGFARTACRLPLKDLHSKLSTLNSLHTQTGTIDFFCLTHTHTHTLTSIVLQPVTDPCHPVLCESVDILSKLELWAVGLLFLDCQQRVSRPVVPSILPASPACPGPIAPLSPYLLSAFAATPPLHAVCHRCHVKLCDRKQQSRCGPNFTEVHLHPQ